MKSNLFNDMNIMVCRIKQIKKLKINIDPLLFILVKSYIN